MGGETCAEMTPCGKSCLACSICGVVVATVMAPIGIFVIGPKVAQHILDTTDISVPNVTMNPCSTLFSLVTNQAIMDASSMWLSSTLHPYNQSLYTTTCLDQSQHPPTMTGGWNCNNATETLLGTYESPALELSSGKNLVNITVGMKLTDASTIINGFVVPLFLYKKRARLILEAKDISISVLGIKISGLTMHKVVTCSQVAMTPPFPIPNSVCHPDQLNHTVDSNNGYTLSCVSDGTEPLNPPTTTYRAQRSWLAPIMPYRARGWRPAHRHIAGTGGVCESVQAMEANSSAAGLVAAGCRAWHRSKASSLQTRE